MFDHDWNCNGKIDGEDRFLDYMIISDMLDENNNNTVYSHSSGSGCGDGVTVLGVGLLIFGVLMLIAIML